MVLVLLAGSELIRQTTARWFSQPVSDVLTSANAIAGTFYRDRQAVVARQATQLAAAVPAQALLSADLDALKASLTAPVMDGRVGMIEIYRLQATADGKSDVVPVVAALGVIVTTLLGIVKTGSRAGFITLAVVGLYVLWRYRSRALVPGLLSIAAIALLVARLCAGRLLGPHEHDILG